MSTKSSPLASPSEPTSRKRGVISTNDTRGWLALLSIPKAGAPSGTQGQTKTANARPNDGRASNGLKGSEVPCGKNHVRHPNANRTPTSRHQTLLTTMTTSRRGTRATTLTREGQFPVARTALLDEHPAASRQRVAQEMQDRHPDLGAEDQARMMLLPVSLVSKATLPAISLVQDGRVSAHDTSKEGSSSGTETNLYGPLWPGQHPLPRTTSNAPSSPGSPVPRSRHWKRTTANRQVAAEQTLRRRPKT